MSQIQKLFDGTVLPDIETISADNAGTVGPIGPDAAFNLNLLTGDGLTTTGNPATNTITITVDGLTLGTAQTIGAATADVVAINLGATASAWIMEAKVIGYDITTPSGIAYNLLVGARTTGGGVPVASLLNIQDKYVCEGTGLGACDAFFVAVGNTIVVRVLGAALKTINWKVITTQMGV